MKQLKAIMLGDAMIPHDGFVKAFDRHLSKYGEVVKYGDFETDWDQLQYRRLEVEKNGPAVEKPDPVILEFGKDANILMGLFIPVSAEVMDAMPDLRIVGVCRAGVENVDVDAATERGILVFNVEGRNAHAVSDFTVGMMLAESRNIARAHMAIKNGQWRKNFPDGDYIPELGDCTVGIIGFGYIGKLVAKKLSGFEPNIIVYDPYCPEEVIREAGCTPVSLETLMKESDFVSVHARLTADNKGLVGEKEIAMMKPTAFLINCGRAGLVDQDALYNALKDNKIAGAALDVYMTEPIAPDDRFVALDNVTLTTHIAGTTTGALMNSPFLLMEDIASYISTGKARFIKNPQVLDDPRFREFMA